MNHTTFIPQLFDARFNGVYSFTSVLEYHKSVEDNMPSDGIVWLCENPKEQELFRRKDDLQKRIKELEEGQKGLPYNCWTLLDKKAHELRCRLQLLTLCINEKIFKKQLP